MPGPKAEHPRPGWLKRGKAVSFVSSPSSVRVRFFRRVKASTVEVYWVPENAIRRIYHRRFKKEPGRTEITLKVVPGGKSREEESISEIWRVAAASLGPQASEFVARASGVPISTSLRVGQKLAFEFENPKWSAGVDLGPIGALIGAITPLKLKRENKRHRLKGTVSAPVDPVFLLRVITPTTKSPNFHAYLAEYLPKVAQELGVADVEGFVDAFNEEYETYLGDGAGLAVEVNPSGKIKLLAGKTREVVVDLYPSGVGHTMFAVAAIHPKTEEVIAVSDLMGLTVGSDGSVYCDF